MIDARLSLNKLLYIWGKLISDNWNRLSMAATNINQDDYTYLYKTYNWFDTKFPGDVQGAFDNFFVDGLKVSLLSVSKNINILMAKESYFVTKIMIDKFRDIYFRAAESTVDAVLYRALGRCQRGFNINKLSDLEAKIITTFNDSLFNKIRPILSPPPPTVKRINFDIIHLTFLVKNEEMDRCGKFIITIPEELLAPEAIESAEDKFSEMDFMANTVKVNIEIGTTKFSVFDLKALDIDDIVVFENSKKDTLKVIYKDYEKDFKIEPNLSLVLPVDDEEEEKMGADNLWDSIEVEMSAQFDTVKITLGDLKKIETGQVVDITPIYDNKITLSVEDKKIATGSLVIVNDKYGVKIEEIAAKSKTQALTQSQESEYDDSDEDFSPMGDSGDFADSSNDENESPLDDMPTGDNDNGDDEEFDYSDFELEDEDI